MKLAFECTLDPRALPIKQGKKFCDNCQKRVTDLRRKSDAKIASFFEANTSPCVIIYQDQLDRLPKRPLRKQQDGFRYLPYAAGLIVASLLPTVTLAQTEILPNAQTVGIKPVTLPALGETPIAGTEQVKAVTDNTRYYLKGKVSIRDKKFKLKRGKDIVIYRYDKGADGSYRENILAVGKMEANGTFKLELDKPVFDAFLLQNEDVYFNVEGFSREILEDVSYTQNTIKINVSVSGRRHIIMGAYF